MRRFVFNYHDDNSTMKIFRLLLLIAAIIGGGWALFVKFLGMSYTTLGIALLGFTLILGIAYFAIKVMNWDRR